MNTFQPIAILGYSQTKFGELWDQNLTDLLKEACLGATENADLNVKDVDAIFVSNMASGSYENQVHLNSVVSSFFPHHPPTFRLEAACASGALAVVAATHALNSGSYKHVLVVGGEKMTDVDVSTATQILAGAALVEKEYGSTFPALYALLAELYKSRYGISEELLRQALSKISSRAHQSAINNKYAQFRKPISVNDVSSSPIIASPLRVLDCSPLSDGASALVLTQDPSKQLYPQLPHLISSGHAQDCPDLASRQDLPHLTASAIASKLAYKKINLKPSDISVVELHDCFTIGEILAIEDLGFIPKGTAVNALVKNSEYRSNLIVNPTGGLKACGHPIGATGIKQIGAVSHYLQTNNTATRYGLTHNVGGTGGTAIVHLIERGNT